MPLVVSHTAAITYNTAIVLLRLLFIFPDTNHCGLKGVWQNQLDSSFAIEWCSEGHVAGRYHSAVGNADDYYDLSGKYTWAESVTNTTVVLAWTVSYNNTANGNSESVCAWSGLYYKADDKIYTHWIMSRAVEREHYWQS